MFKRDCLFRVDNDVFVSMNLLCQVGGVGLFERERIRGYPTGVLV
jgi:hypothetical protein